MLINGKEYGYSSLKISFLGGLDIAGVKSISYKVKKESENLMGTGDEPVGIGYGPKEYEAEIQLMRKDIIMLQKTAGLVSLVEIDPFPIVILFANGTDPISTVVLEHARFMEDGMEGSTGDKELPLTIPLGISGIKYL
jgi:hypothetical protein